MPSNTDMAHLLHYPAKTWTHDLLLTDSMKYQVSHGATLVELSTQALYSRLEYLEVFYGSQGEGADLSVALKE